MPARVINSVIALLRLAMGMMNPPGSEIEAESVGLTFVIGMPNDLPRREESNSSQRITTA